MLSVILLLEGIVILSHLSRILCILLYLINVNGFQERLIGRLVKDMLFHLIAVLRQILFMYGYYALGNTLQVVIRLKEQHLCHAVVQRLIINGVLGCHLSELHCS